MRVIALGGAGGMGVWACRAVAQSGQVTELTVADLDAGRAARVAAELGPQARGAGLDVTDTAALRDVLSEADVVLNTVGPFFRFGVSILRAAIDAGSCYIDICDDWEPMAEMLELDAAAKAAGATALVGMGASPGITNLLAVLAARELDTVSGIITGWNIEAAQPEHVRTGRPSAAVVHGIQQATGTIEVTRGGRLASERPLRPVEIGYPGVGTKRVWTFGHPEAITLPREFPGATSLNVTFGSRGLMAALKAIAAGVDRGYLTPARAAAIIDRAEQLMPSDFARTLRPGRLPPLFALATGTHEARAASAACALAQIPGTTMGEVTGIPMAAALDLLPGAPPGVHTPESLLDPGSYFAALAPHCLGQPTPADMVTITRSWDLAPEQTIEATLTAARARLNGGI
jgi:saccharopine dehydrogenase-like NADP-dependent oxidoreductase